MIGFKFEWTDYIFFALLALVVVILGININLPPIDAHAWRQAYTLGVARGFFEYGAHPFFPQTIILDSGDGIISQEFPLLNWLLALLWSIFGEQDWVFRGITSVTFIAGLYHLFSFTKRIFGESVGIFGICILATSSFLAYANRAMPDIFGISLVFISLNCALEYLLKGRLKHLIAFSLLLGLGVLCKLPSSIPSLLILVPILERGLADPRVKKLMVAGLISVFLVVLWYFVWIPYLEDNYRFKLYYATSISQGWEEVKSNIEIVKDKFSFNLFRNSLTIWVVLIGLMLTLIKRKFELILVICVSLVLGLFFMLKTGVIFCTHEYYYLPFAPILSVLAGYSLSKLWKYSGLATLILLLFLVGYSVKNQKTNYNVWAEHHKYLRLESIVDQHVPKESRILTNDEMISPRMMYFAHRRGWNDQRYEDVEWIKGEYTVGMEYLVFRKDRLKIRHPFPVLFEDDDFIIYKIEI